MASELLKNKALIQKLKEPDVPIINFDLANSALDYSIESTEEELLPKEKPIELFEDRERVRTERLSDTLKKIGGGLMDESVDFIEREELKAEGGRIGFANGKSAAQRQREYRERNPYKLKTTDIFVDGVKYTIPNNAMNPEAAKGLIKFLNKLEKNPTLDNYRELVAGLDKKNKNVGDQIRNYRYYLQGEKKGAFIGRDGKETGVAMRKLFDEIKSKLPKQSTELLSKITSKDIKGQVVKTATKAAGEAAKGTSMDVVNAVRDIFVNDPNNAPSLDDVAEGLEGTKKFNAASASEKIKMRTAAKNSVKTFLEAVTGDRKVKGFKDIAPETLGDIIQYIDDNKRGEFGFAEGLIRDYKIKLRDSLIKGDFAKQRRNLRGQEKGKVIDEVFGLSATFENAPGYTENVQIISEEANKLKRTQIDKPFTAILKAVKEGKDTITFDKKRDVPISEAIKKFNLKSKTFSNVNKISTPQILLGDNLDATKLVSNFKDYSPQAQKNILDLADEGFVLTSTKPATPVGKLAFKPGMQESGQKKLTALQQIASGKNVGVDPVLLTKAGFEEFVKPAAKMGARGAAGLADLAISAGKGGTGLAIGALLEADPIITGMSEGKDFGQTARDTFIGSVIDAIPGVNLGSLNEDLIKLADTEEQRVAVQNLIDYQKDYERFNKDLNAFRAYEKLDQNSLDELGFTASDLVNMESQLAKRYRDITDRAPKVYNPDVLGLVKGLARKEAEKRKENLEGVQGLIFGDRMIQDSDFVDKKTDQIMRAATGVEGATDSYADAYKSLPQPELSLEELDDIYEMGGIMGAAEGGRIGFAEGPMDPKRRLFLKLMTGIMTLPVFSKFLGKSEVAKPVVKLAGTTTKMPDWFPDFVNKMMFSTGGKKIDADLMEYTTPELPGVKMTRSDDGRITVEGKNGYGEPYEIEYTPPGFELIDETTGKVVKVPGEFRANDTVYRRVGPEGDDFDVDFEVVDDVEQILGGDSTKLEGFAKGTNESKYTKGQRNLDAADAIGERADEFSPYGDVDPTDFVDE